VASVESLAERQPWNPEIVGKGWEKIWRYALRGVVRRRRRQGLTILGERERGKEQRPDSEKLSGCALYRRRERTRTKGDCLLEKKPADARQAKRGLPADRKHDSRKRDFFARKESDQGRKKLIPGCGIKPEDPEDGDELRDFSARK